MLMRPWIRTVLPLKAVQPGLITDRAQVLNKAGENLVRVRLAEVDESNTFWRCLNAGNHSLPQHKPPRRRAGRPPLE